MKVLSMIESDTFHSFPCLCMLALMLTLKCPSRASLAQYSVLIQIHVDIAMSNRTCQDALSLDEVRLLHLDGFLTVLLLHASCDPGFCLPWAPKPVVLLDWQEHDKWDALKLMFRRERESLEKLREDKARSWLICSSAHMGLPIVYIC